MLTKFTKSFTKFTKRLLNSLQKVYKIYKAFLHFSETYEIEWFRKHVIFIRNKSEIFFNVKWKKKRNL
jgi:hypothetical protein